MSTQDISARSATTTPMPSVRNQQEVAKLIDVSKCIGCKACQVACSEWNELRDEVGHNHGVYDNPLDLTGVHPETYPVVQRILDRVGRPVAEVMGKSDVLRTLKPEMFADETFGAITVKDILTELEKPGRDPRPDFKVARFNEGVDDIKDLVEGMVLEGTVSNVAQFGAFVDLGVHQDGLHACFHAGLAPAGERGGLAHDRDPPHGGAGKLREGPGLMGVVVEAAAALAPQAPGRDHALLDRVRLEARLAEEGRVDRLRDGEVHVQADQVHQLEGAHAEAAGLHAGVERRHRPAALAQDLERLAVERPRHKHRVNPPHQCQILSVMRRFRPVDARACQPKQGTLAPHRELHVTAVEQGSPVRRAHLPDLRAKKSRSTISSPILACRRSISCPA